MLDVKDIHKTFNKGTVNEKRALQGLSLHLNDGDFVTVIGGNGAGFEHFFDRIADVRVGKNGFAGNFRNFAEAHIAHANAAHDGNAVGSGFGQNFFREAITANIDAVFLEFLGHFLNEQIRAALENVNALAHEVGENDSVGDGGFIERGAVCVGDRFEKQAPDVGASGEKFFEEFPRRAFVVVVVIHLREMLEKSVHALCGNAEFFDENAREVFAVKSRLDIEFRIDEADVFELVNRIRDFFAPVFAAGFDHAVRETVERNIENMSARALKIRRQPAELVVVLEKQNRVFRLGEIVCAGEPGETAADDDRVVIFLNAEKRIFCVHLRREE